jgi:hypothetical protein
MAKKAGSKSRPSGGPKKASAKPSETEGPPRAPEPPKWTRFPPTPPSLFMLGNLNSEERQNRRDQYDRDQQTWEREQRIERALAEAQAAQRKLDQQLEARAVRAITGKLLQGPESSASPAPARGERRSKGGRKGLSQLELDLVLAQHSRFYAEHQRSAAAKTATWTKSKAAKTSGLSKSLSAGRIRALVRGSVK